MLNQILDVVGQLGYGAYLIIFVVVFLECAAFVGFIIPGETAALFGGFLASQGVLDLWIVGALVGLGLVASQLFRLKDWLNRQPPVQPHPEGSEDS